MDTMDHQSLCYRRPIHLASPRTWPALHPLLPARTRMSQVNVANAVVVDRLALAGRSTWRRTDYRPRLILMSSRSPRHLKLLLPLKIRPPRPPRRLLPLETKAIGSVRSSI